MDSVWISVNLLSGNVFHFIKNEFAYFDIKGSSMKIYLHIKWAMRDLLMSTQSVLKSISVPVLFWGFVPLASSVLREMYRCVVQVLNFMLIPLWCSDVVVCFGLWRFLILTSRSSFQLPGTVKSESLQDFCLLCGHLYPGEGLCSA